MKTTSCKPVDQKEIKIEREEDGDVSSTSQENGMAAGPSNCMSDVSLLSPPHSHSSSPSLHHSAYVPQQLQPSHPPSSSSSVPVPSYLHNVPVGGSLGGHFSSLSSPVQVGPAPPHPSHSQHPSSSGVHLPPPTFGLHDPTNPLHMPLRLPDLKNDNNILSGLNSGYH